MALVIDLNTQPSPEEFHSFYTDIDMDDINICNSSSNFATETECTTDVINHHTISDVEIPKVEMLFETLEEARQFYNYANKVALADEVGGRSNLKFLEKDVRNYISGKLRINGDDTDAQEMLDYFTKMKEQNPNFFYDICVYSDNSLKHAFWADARSRIAYEYFGDVVSFDTTYKLNKYKMSVVAFVGVNHHGRSCLFGCALLENEETESFE
ncbi:protein FAR1-RELATED SEQUENCE 5-like [Arachis stenosperma]|uniref:protein FAR1-RELATED SEQUENCE 5-like n=1 Tax=Arachis stenosperma TaxID=217475 RepID=UPI0025ACFAEF|nr:protein FAR1-RELATED SEQUENCE 5-like [Arachis stenosperma]